MIDLLKARILRNNLINLPRFYSLLHSPTFLDELKAKRAVLK